MKQYRKILVSIIVTVTVLPTVAQWDNSHKYVNTVYFDNVPPGYYTGGGCFGFMMDMMEYASNYEYPIRIIEGTYDNLPKIHVGDGVRLMNDCHSVVVLEVNGSEIIVAEANVNGKVRWGEVYDLSAVYVGFNYIATFWPEESNAISTGIIDNVNDSPTRDLRIYNLNGVLVKRISQTGLSVKAVLQELPKGFYIVKEATKSYKIYNGE